jgi:hypothetical protein
VANRLANPMANCSWPTGGVLANPWPTIPAGITPTSQSDFSFPQTGFSSSHVEQSQLLPPGSQLNTTPPWAMLLSVQSSGTGQSVVQLSGYNSGVPFWQVNFMMEPFEFG